MSSLYSVGAMNQLADALEAAGFTPDDVTLLKQYKGLTNVRDILHNRAEIKAVQHLIDCDASPFIPNGWKIEEHRKGGQLEWNPNKAQLYLSKRQQGRNNYISGHNLRKELAGLSVMNANVLDYLFAHQDLIPKEWKGKHVFFWGTIYCNSRGRLCVRFLYWGGERWNWNHHWLDGDFLGHDPTALLAS